MPRILLSIFILMCNTHVLIAQTIISKSTKPAAFSPTAIADAVKNINALNQSNTIKVYLYTSVFYLGTGPAVIKSKPIVNDPAKPLTEEELINQMMEEQNDAKRTKFPDLQKKADINAQKILNGLQDKDHVLLINISLAFRLLAMGRPPYYKKSYFNITVLAGSKIPSSTKDDLQAYFNAPTGSVDFNDEDKFKANDKFLRDIMDHLYNNVLPVTIKYDDPGNLNFDSNNSADCATHPSFKTKPITGIPWKCIPTDGTFTAVKVTVDTKAQTSTTIEFKVSDDVKFKLKSPKLDNQSMLYISGNTNNAETSIIPVINGTPTEIQKINIVSYDKIKMDVAVVMIEEENDDVQLVKMDTENLTPTTPVVGSGANKFLDSTVGGDDLAIKNAAGDSVIVAGQNGICETLAVDFNLKPANIDRAELERQLNMFYNPVMVEWTVDQTEYKVPVNYDLNKNGALDLKPIAPKGVVVHAPEEELINAKGKVTSKMHHLFLVNDYYRDPLDESEIRGRTTGDLKSANIFTEVHKQSIKKAKDASSLPPLQDYLIMTCTHELCHTISVMLRDLPPDDSLNLMAIGHSTWLNKAAFRKFQWDLIHQ